jgi:hypothetical protein
MLTLSGLLVYLILDSLWDFPTTRTSIPAVTSTGTRHAFHSKLITSPVTAEIRSTSTAVRNNVQDEHSGG